MTVAAVSHIASHSAASQVLPQGHSDKEQQILLLMILATVIIFIQHDNAGKPQDGTQYAALGVVGFALLVLAQFWPDIAFTFTILFVVAVILNSPNGVPIVGKLKKGPAPAAASSSSDNTVNQPSSGPTPGTPNVGGSVFGGGSLHP